MTLPEQLDWVQKVTFLTNHFNLLHIQTYLCCFHDSLSQTAYLQMNFGYIFGCNYYSIKTLLHNNNFYLKVHLKPRFVACLMEKHSYVPGTVVT